MVKNLAKRQIILNNNFEPILLLTASILVLAFSNFVCLQMLLFSLFFKICEFATQLKTQRTLRESIKDVAIFSDVYPLSLMYTIAGSEY